MRILHEQVYFQYIIVVNESYVLVRLNFTTNLFLLCVIYFIIVQLTLQTIIFGDSISPGRHNSCSYVIGIRRLVINVFSSWIFYQQYCPVWNLPCDPFMWQRGSACHFGFPLAIRNLLLTANTFIFLWQIMKWSRALGGMGRIIWLLRTDKKNTSVGSSFDWHFDHWLP